MGMRIVMYVLLGVLFGGCAPGGGGSGGDNGGPFEPVSGGCSVQLFEGDIYATDTCSGNEICICPAGNSCASGGTCEAAFNRRYELVMRAAVYPERRPDGQCWDAACGAPDPFVNVWVDGEFVGGTPTRQDTFRPEWDVNSDGELGRVTVLPGSIIDIEAGDEDISVNDPGLICELDMTAQFLRNRIIACATADESFIVVGAIRP